MTWQKNVFDRDSSDFEYQLPVRMMAGEGVAWIAGFGCLKEQEAICYGRGALGEHYEFHAKKVRIHKEFESLELVFSKRNP